MEEAKNTGNLILTISQTKPCLNDECSKDRKSYHSDSMSSLGVDTAASLSSVGILFAANIFDGAKVRYFTPF